MSMIFNPWLALALALYLLAALWMYHYQDDTGRKSVRLFVSFCWPLVWFLAVTGLIIRGRKR